MAKSKSKKSKSVADGANGAATSSQSSSSPPNTQTITNGSAISSNSSHSVSCSPMVPPMPNPATGSANPSTSLPALWGYIQPALDHIVRSPTNNSVKAPAIDVAYHMGIHTAVYNYFTAQSEASSNGSGPVPGPLIVPSSIGLGPKSVGIPPLMPPFQRADKGKASGTDLYEQLDRYYADTAREIFLGTPHDDSSLIHYLVPCFNRYSAGVQSVNRLLNYVNRHYVKRAIDEDKGWLRLADVFDAVAKSMKEDDTREKIQKRLKERRLEELKKWGYREDGGPDILALSEACAEAASTPDRVVSLSSLGYRRFRTECIDPLLAVPKLKRGKKRKIPVNSGDSLPLPKGRLARAVKELVEGEGGDVEERRRLAGELAILLRTVGIKVDHPLRKKIDRYIPLVAASSGS
ncbi:hypothetical protein ABKN59_001096 [Abortiporus biennis]